LELVGYCYRMLGSVDEAEDVVQETYLRAWRSYGGFEGRSSVRSWLYRIATNACFTALEQRGRRALPSGLGDPSDDPGVTLTRLDVPWLQPIPDERINGTDPASVVTARARLRLAYVAAMQRLPARQRAVLILRDVLAWRASEVAELLNVSPVAVKSMLQRAREQLRRVAPDEDELAEPTDRQVRMRVDQFMAAFEDANVDALIGLLRADVGLEMPPYATWFSGRSAVVRFLAERVVRGPGGLQAIAVRANGQPAIAMYARDAACVYRAHALFVLTVTATGIARIVVFLDPRLFVAFELPPVMSTRMMGART
jgi:RNA polymerase sigma-70 factor (ECF subfamily)